MRNLLLAAGLAALLVPMASAQQVHKGRAHLGRVHNVHTTPMNSRVTIGKLPKGFKLPKISSGVTQKKQGN